MDAYNENSLDGEPYQNKLAHIFHILGCLLASEQALLIENVLDSSVLVDGEEIGNSVN